MATDKQIKANRKNAKKSTGPKTADGKAAVSKNAVKHGLFADSVVTGETEAEYEAFHGELLAELAPRGVVGITAGRKGRQPLVAADTRRTHAKPGHRGDDRVRCY